MSSAPLVTRVPVSASAGSPGADSPDSFSRDGVEPQHVVGVSESAGFTLHDERLDALREIPQQPIAFRVCARSAIRFVVAEPRKGLLEPSAGTTERSGLFLGDFVLERVDELFAHSCSPQWAFQL